MFDILVADKLADEGLKILKEQPDVKLTVIPKWEKGELAKVLGNYDGVIIRSGVSIKAAELTNPGKLKAIARAGVGVDNVDVEAATKAGVLVMNTPDANTLTTAEHAVALMMAALPQDSSAGRFAAFGEVGSQCVRWGPVLAGKTLGIIGFGRDWAGRGQALGLEMKVVAFDKFYFAETAFDGQVKMIKDF